MFKHDLLLVDLETTGIHSTENDIIQIAAVLLDKKTLKEKKHFNTFVFPERWSKRSKEAMAINHISWEQLKDAPKIKPALKKFVAAFPSDATLANYGGVLDMSFLNVAFKENGIKNPFDYHAFNMWPLFYVFMAEHTKLANKLKMPGFSLEDMVELFNISVEGERHDALTDCRVEAEIFRHVMAVMYPKRFKVPGLKVGKK